MYLCDWKLAIVKHEISHWQSNGRKMMSHSNFKLKCFKRFWDEIRGFMFQVGVIWEAWFPGVIIQLKVTTLKERISHWPDNHEKTMSQSKFKLSISERALGESQTFFVPIWFGLRSQKMAIIKEEHHICLGTTKI